MLSRVKSPDLWFHTVPSVGPQLPLSPAHSSPVPSLGCSENTWLMVRFCRAVRSEIMSLDLRRSSMCTDCHSPAGESTHFNLGYGLSEMQSVHLDSFCYRIKDCTFLSVRSLNSTNNQSEEWPCKTEPPHTQLTWLRRRAGHPESHPQSLSE
uniref:Uncharacterized protein n=1 Tax=Zosterops lateralis melanops TaxID=1220523 RepID=A0A8D2NRB6_ZOSLA